MIDDGIAFNADNAPPTATNTDSGINLTPSSPILPDHVVVARADRADFALGEDSPGKPALQGQIRSGNEFGLRQTAAAKADTDFQTQKLAMVQKMVGDGQNLSGDQISSLVNVGTTPQANPNTVWEDKFGSKMMGTGIAGEPGKNLVFQSAFDTEAEKTTQGAQLGAAVVSRKQQVRNVLEETQSAYDAKPWVTTGNDIRPGAKLTNLAKDFLTFGISQYVNQRNLLNSDPENASYLPGTNKLEQIQWLYLQPDPAGILRQVAGPGSKFFEENPSDALDFIKAAHQYGTSDALVDNIFGVANAATVPGVGFAGKALLRAGASTLGRKVPAAAVATLEDLERGTKAAKDILGESSKPPATPGTSAAQTAADVLSGSPKPPEAGYYLPTAAVKRPWEAQPRIGETRVENGVPRVFTADGAEVALSRTPQEGHVKVEVTPPSDNPSYTTRDGQVTPYTPGEHPPGRVFVTKPEADNLVAVLDKDKNYQLLTDEKGRVYVGNRDNGGKRVSGTKLVTPKSEPASGLHAIDIGEGNDQSTFNPNRITRVDQGTAQGVKFGPEIITPVEKETRVALADIVRSQAEDNPANTLGRMGMHDSAAQVSANEQLGEEAAQKPNADPNVIARRVPTSAQPIPYYNDASSMFWRRAMEIYDEFKGALGATRVERLAPAAWQQAQTLAQQAISKYNRISGDALRDQITHWDPLTNTYKVESRIGKPDGTLFDTAANAAYYKNMQYRLGSSATVEQEGTKFYLSHLKHFDETQSAVREAIPLGNETPKGWLKSWLAMATGQVGPSIRSSAYTVSGFQRQARNTATHAPSVLRGAIEDEAETLRKLGDTMNTKGERTEVTDMLVHNRDYIPPGGTGKDRGFFYSGPQEFEQAFYAKFQKLPTDAQQKAYESFKKISDLDWVLREAEDMRDKTRQGVRKYQFSFVNRDGEKVKTDWIDGKEVPDFNPNITPDANVYDLKSNAFTSKYDLKDGSAESKEILEKLKSGEKKIIQMYAPREKPMNATTGIKDDIHFVLADKFDERAVQFGENVEYRPGGHVIYVPQHYVKQPQIGIGTKGKMTYFGDTAMKAFETQKDAEAWAEKYNVARDHYRTGDVAAFDNYVSKNLPETPQDLRARFQDGTFNADHPFMHTFAGRDTLQSNPDFVAHNPTYRGLADTFSAYNMKQSADSAFLADRGVQLSTVKNAGTEANPIYHNVDAPLMDPFTSLGKGISQITRARWMSDYKIQAAESWIAEFGHMFDQSKLPMDRLRLNPLYYLYHDDGIDKAVIKANPEAYAAMKTSKDAIIRFIGSKDETGSMIDGLTLRLLNGIDKTLGTKAASGVEKALPFITNVPQYIRTATFDMVDGMFNIVQFPQQALGFTNALAISPKNAMHSMTAMVLANRMQYTEDAAILGRFADQAAKLGWNRDHFLEAYSAWKDGGVHQIGGEVSARSTWDDPKLFQSLWGSVVDKGRFFFKKGEQINRDVSYFTAYRDWKDANPTRVLDNRAKTEVMARFDTLSMNMTKASNAAYNEGILSIPTQFWTWNARHAEQMMSFGAGRQLTVAEKARVLGMNALLYGVPSAIGGATFGGFGVIPYTNFDDIRQYAISKGINLHDNFMSAVMKGIPEMALNAITGAVTGKQGDIDLHRFSPNADQVQTAVKVFKGDETAHKSMSDLLLGASGSMVLKVAAASYPFAVYAMSAFDKDSKYPITTNDFANIAENVSSFNNAEKGWVAWNTGRYISKTEGVQASDREGQKVDKFESVLLGLGLSLNRVSDAWSGKSILEGQKSAKGKIEKMILENAQIMFNAGQRGDQPTFDDYATRIKTLTAMGGFNAHEQGQIWKRAAHGNESLIDNVNRQWLQKGPDMMNSEKVLQFFNNIK